MLIPTIPTNPMNRKPLRVLAAQPIERKGPVAARTERLTIQMLPVLIDEAPRDFEACGASFERLRKQYGCTWRRAVELVVLGVWRATKRDRRNAA